MVDDWIVPDWPAPSRVRACVTTRGGGCSRGPWDSLNLGDHVGDDPLAVAANRERVVRALGLPAPPLWLKQVHGCDILEAERAQPGCEADGSVSRTPGKVCAVMSADCLPVLLCDRRGGCVAAVHAGWRGLAAGVIEAAVERMGVPSSGILAWLGPAIGPDRFEVGEEVRAAFLERDQGAAENFRPAGSRWLADIYALARARLRHCGVEAVYGGAWCTFSDEARFFSYRRDGVTGRMASLIWLT